MAGSPYSCNDSKWDLSQEIVATDILKALKQSSEHSRKHVLRLLPLHGDQGERDGDQA